MDVLILAAGLSSRLSSYTFDLYPKYLINIDHHTGLYHILHYWNIYARTIYIVIHSKFHMITQFYIESILPELSNKIKLIHYDLCDGTAYTLQYVLSHLLQDEPIEHLFITWCDLYMKEPIDLTQMTSSETTIYVFTSGNECRYTLTHENTIIQAPLCDGNIVGIFYIQHYQSFSFGEECKYHDIVEYLHLLGKIINIPINTIIDYG